MNLDNNDNDKLLLTHSLIIITRKKIIYITNIKTIAKIMIGGVKDDQYVVFILKTYYVDQESRLSVNGFPVSNHVKPSAQN